MNITMNSIYDMYKKVMDDGMDYLEVYYNINYMKDFILNYDKDKDASLCSYASYCEEVLGIPP